MNNEGEIFSIIIATATTYQADEIRDSRGRTEAIIRGKRYVSHIEDEVVMLDVEGKPTYLLYPSEPKLRRIECIATDRPFLQWHLNRIMDSTDGAIHLRKSKILPGSILSEILARS